MAMLEVKNLGISFGGLRAVDGLDMTIEKGELYGLIGPNGAGKTTAFNMLTGVYKPTDGVIKTSQARVPLRSIRQVSPVHSRISVFSRNYLFWTMSKSACTIITNILQSQVS